MFFQMTDMCFPAGLRARSLTRAFMLVSRCAGPHRGRICV